MTRVLTLSADARREIDAAIKEIAADRGQKAVDRLCAMRGHMATPNVKAARKTELAQLRADKERLTRELTHARAVVQVVADEGDPVVEAERHLRSSKPFRSFPKATHRYVNKDRVAEFRALYPRCCILGCDETDADPHHWWARGNGGPDEHALMSPLGRRHHDEAEDLGREAFCAKYASRMAPIDLLKAKLAGMMQEQAKLGDRDAIDLDADLDDAERTA